MGTLQLGRTKAIKHNGGGVVVYFRSHLSPNLSQWKEGNHDSCLWLWVSRGATLDLFLYAVYATPIGSKHENKSLFQNLVVYIAKVQILRGNNTIGRGL
jgi:hypothetical protein